MSSILKRSIGSTRLGDLLVQAGILTQVQLGEAMRSAKGKGMQIGQVLVMNGLISPRDLQSALEAQSMLRDRRVEQNEALRCLKIAYKVGAPFKDILFEYASPKKTQSSKLGELLVESGLVTYELLAKAVEQSNTTGLPLGRMLVLHQIISNDLLNLVLDLQVRVRDEMMTRDEALAVLREKAGITDVPVPDAAPPKLAEAPRKKGLRLGELMVMAGVLTETDVMNALEWGLVNQQSIGQVLISQMLVSQGILDAALGLQKLVDKGELNPTKASECLARVHSGGTTLEEAVKEVKEEKDAEETGLSFESLLTLAGVISEDELDDAFDMSSKSAAIVGKFLVLTGHLDVATLQSALRCYQLLSKGLIQQDDAVVTLDYSLHQSPVGPMKFDDALKELGWSKEKGLRLMGEKLDARVPTQNNLTAQAAANAEKEVAGAEVAAASAAGAGSAGTEAAGIASAQASNAQAAGAEAASAQGAGAEAATGQAAALEQASAGEPALAADTTSTAQAEAASPQAPQANQTAQAAQAAETSQGNAAPTAAVEANLSITKPSELVRADDIIETMIASEMTVLEPLSPSPAASAKKEVTSFEELDVPPEAVQADPVPLDASEDLELGEAKPISKPKKHSQTIQPSDARATRLASLLKGQNPGDKDLVGGFDPTSDPPSALHRVFERLAHSYFRQGNFPQAQVIYERVLVHRLNQMGPSDPNLVTDLSNLAGTLLAQEKFDQAEPFVRRAVVILEGQNQDPLKMAELLSILANIYMRQEKLTESESMLRRCYEIRKSHRVLDHPDLAQTLSDYAKLLRKMGRGEEAEVMYKQSLAILGRLERASQEAEEAEAEAEEPAQ